MGAGIPLGASQNSERLPMLTNSDFIQTDSDFIQTDKNRQEKITPAHH